MNQISNVLKRINNGARQAILFTVCDRNEGWIVDKGVNE